MSNFYFVIAQQAGKFAIIDTHKMPATQGRITTPWQSIEVEQFPGMTQKTRTLNYDTILHLSNDIVYVVFIGH